MSLPIVLRPEARSDVAEAREWYDAKRSNWGQRFLDELDRLLQRIQADPELYAIVFRNVRRALMRRFPYVVYYRVLVGAIDVVAVLHGRRDPQIWHRRV